MLHTIKAASSAVVIAVLLISKGQAAELDLNLNDDAARLTFATDITDRRLRYDFGWLHHQDRGDVVHAGLHLTGDASSGSSPLIGGLGGRLVAVDSSVADLNAVALAIGGFMRYTLPRYDRVNFSGHLYFAPDVLSFSDGDSFREIEARVGYNVLRDADVYVGLRHIKTEFDGGSEATMDNGLFAGIQLRF